MFKKTLEEKDNSTFTIWANSYGHSIHLIHAGLETGIWYRNCLYQECLWHEPAPEVIEEKETFQGYKVEGSQDHPQVWWGMRTREED